MKTLLPAPKKTLLRTPDSHLQPHSFLGSFIGGFYRRLTAAFTLTIVFGFFFNESLLRQHAVVNCSDDPVDRNAW